MREELLRDITEMLVQNHEYPGMAVTFIDPYLDVADGIVVVQLDEREKHENRT